MTFERRPGLPAVEKQHREFIEAAEEINGVYGQCAQELAQAVENYERFTEYRGQIADWAKQLQEAYDQRVAGSDSEDRQDLLSKWGDAQKELKRLNGMLEELFKEINELNGAMIALRLTPKRPEVAEA